MSLTPAAGPLAACRLSPLSRAAVGAPVDLSRGAEDLLRQDEAAAAVPMATFLDRLGLSALAPVFERERVTPDMLPYIHDTTLLQLGVSSVRDLVRDP